MQADVVRIKRAQPNYSVETINRDEPNSQRALLQSMTTSFHEFNQSTSKLKYRVDMYSNFYNCIRFGNTANISQ